MNLSLFDLPASWLFWRSWRFLQLLIFMLAVLLLTPFQAGHPLLFLAMHLIMLNGMVVSLSAAGFAPRMQWAFFALWLIFILLDVSAGMAGDPRQATALYVLGRVASMLLLAGLVTATLRYVLRSRTVTTDSITAAAVAYLFIGMAFAAAYTSLIVLDARSFAIPSDMTVANRNDLEVAMMYFSYVTLATLGYGDIAPRLPLTQMLAVLEAMIGQFYIAVVIAWLVSVYATAKAAGSPKGKDNED